MDDILMKQSTAVSNDSKMIQNNSVRTKNHNRVASPNATDKSSRRMEDTSHLKNLVHQANIKTGTYNNKITFQLGKDGNTPKIIVLDKESGKVIRQIPSVEMEKIKSQMEKFIGTIFNGRV